MHPPKWYRVLSLLAGELYDMPCNLVIISETEHLGILEEFLYLKAHTQKPIKVTCTGPLTMTMPIELGNVYKDRIELAAEVAHVINAELKALVAAGAEFIQIDEPSYAFLPGSMKEWVAVFNEAVDGVKA